MKQYLQYRCWDWILCNLISIGLIVNILSGFEIDNMDLYMPVLVGLTVGLTFVYFLAAVNKITAITGILAGIMVLIGTILLCRRVNPFLNDQEYATQIVCIIIAAVSLAVFLVCRTKAGIILLFLAGNVVQAGAAFLQFPCKLWAYILFLASSGLMIFYRVYVISIMKSHTGKIRFKGFMIQNICVCMTALMLAFAVFVGIIKPMNPPTDELKLIQKMMSLEVLEKIGVSSILVQVDPNKQSDQLPDDQLTTDQKDEGEEEKGNDASENSLYNGIKQLSGNAVDSAADQMRKAMAVSYDIAGYWYLYLIGIVVLIGLVIFLKKFLRKRWLDQIDRLPRADAVVNLYSFFLFGLSKAGCAKAGNITLDEYLSLNADQLHKFDHESVGFEKLTDTYRKAYYGRQAVSDEEYGDFRLYYSVFHKNVCKAVGKIRYIPLYFRL